jgi:phospho-N-acetylmuramoyl-pentapeptide-transferase
MLKLLSQLLQDEINGLGFLRLFHYLSFRTVMAAMTTFIISLLIGSKMIRFLHHHKMRDVVEDYGIIDVCNKRGTPSMGGLIIIIAFLGGYLLWCDLKSPFAWAGISSLLWFGAIGFIDDLQKIRGGGGASGLSQITKIVLQLSYAVVFSWWLLSSYSPVPTDLQTQLFIPFFKDPLIDLGMFYMPLISFVILAVANSVNFADGMDGLATVPVAMSFVVYAVFAYVIGNEFYSAYLQFDYILGAGEIAVISGAIIGTSLGFLWYNFFPAQIFMGDTGSMALGGMLSVIMLMLKQEFLFVIVGGIFVLEGASSMIQEKIGINFLGRRIFFRAPIHHAIDHRGVSETKVVIRFWIISLILGFIGLLSLKIR